MGVKGKVKKATILARVYRAKTGQWKNLGVIARSKESFWQKLRRCFDWFWTL